MDATKAEYCLSDMGKMVFGITHFCVGCGILRFVLASCFASFSKVGVTVYCICSNGRRYPAGVREIEAANNRGSQ